MAERIRIYQLAKDLDLETKAMLEHLDDMGVEYKSHSSTIDAETADAVRQLVKDAAADTDTPAAQQSQGGGTATATQTETETATATEAAGDSERREQLAEAAGEASDSDLPTRAPVVTVMGHVDHGKTTLLDTIRKAKVAAGEAGGITQHIGAYQVPVPSGGSVTFLDTPGHEAFTTIRQRGASATDIAIIVVAADDSIMPQTREAIAHAKAADVPIIVAINKVDLPQSNPDKVMQDLMQVELIPEDYGGETITVRVSALRGDGIDELLEMIALVAEVEDLRATPEGPAEGVVIESILDKKAGVLATILVQQGTLNVSDYLVSGEAWAKVKRLTDSASKQIKEAGPSVPVQVLGFSSQPLAGDRIVAVGSEQEAKDLVAERVERREEKEREMIGKKNVTLADLFGGKKATKINLILRADTQGSLEAIKGVLAKEAEGTDEVDLEIMLDAVGAPTESDLLLAGTADATVISFGVNPAGSVKKAAEKQGVPLKTYKIIYQLIEDVQRMIKGHIEPEYEEQVVGHAEVRQVIKVPRSGNIAGSYVTDGTIRRNAKARLKRNGKEVYKGSIAQLRRFKDDVREVSSGFECGINLQNYDNVQEGDIIEVYEMVEIPV